MINMEKGPIILVTGASGLVGHCLVNELKSLGYQKILTPPSRELDLRNQIEVDKYFRINKIDLVYHLAAQVGGMTAKISSPAEFLYDNIMIACNPIKASIKYKVKKLIFISSSTIYSTEGKQPFKEDSPLLGKLEVKNEGYALAKIVGLKLCEYYNQHQNSKFIVLVASNLYGPNDNLYPHPHVIPSLIVKFHNAKINDLPYVEIIGSGNAKREFLFVHDIVDAIVYFSNKSKEKNLKSRINLGFGGDISIKNLSHLVKEIIGYKGDVKFNKNKSEGAKHRLLDIGKAKKLGWKPKVSLREGITRRYDWYLSQI